MDRSTGTTPGTMVENEASGAKTTHQLSRVPAAPGFIAARAQFLPAGRANAVAGQGQAAPACCGYDEGNVGEDAHTAKRRARETRKNILEAGPPARKCRSPPHIDRCVPRILVGFWV